MNNIYFLIDKEKDLDAFITIYTSKKDLLETINNNYESGMFLNKDGLTANPDIFDWNPTKFTVIEGRVADMQTGYRIGPKEDKG